jgi:hypothetical protein
MYLEAVAMLPQIFMFQKQASDQGGIVEVRDIYKYTYLYMYILDCMGFLCVDLDTSTISQ